MEPLKRGAHASPRLQRRLLKMEEKKAGKGALLDEHAAKAALEAGRVRFEAAKAAVALVEAKVEACKAKLANVRAAARSPRRPPPVARDVAEAELATAKVERRMAKTACDTAATQLDRFAQLALARTCLAVADRAVARLPASAVAIAEQAAAHAAVRAAEGAAQNVNLVEAYLQLLQSHIESRMACVVCALARCRRCGN